MLDARRRWAATFIMLTAIFTVGCGILDLPAAKPSISTDFRHVVLSETAVFGRNIHAVTYQTVTIDAQTGVFRVERRDAEPVEGVLSTGEIAALRGLLALVGFVDLKKDYTRVDDNCCTMIHYTIAVDHGGRVSSVTAGDEGMPAGFRLLLRYIQAVTLS